MNNSTNTVQTAIKKDSYMTLAEAICQLREEHASINRELSHLSADQWLDAHGQKLANREQELHTTLGVLERLHANLAGVSAPVAVTRPVVWRLRNIAFRSEVYEYFRSQSSAEWRQKQFNAQVDDGGLHELTPLYTAPQAQADARDAWQPIETAIATPAAPQEASTLDFTVAVPPEATGLSGDAGLAHENCRAVVHLLLALARVYVANASTVAHNPTLADQIGYAASRVMEWLGDEINATDAVDEDDEWLDSVFAATQERWGDSTAAPVEKASDDILTMADAIIMQRATDARDAARYRWLRSRDLDAISQGGVFAGMTPENVILNGEDLDEAIDAAIAAMGAMEGGAA